MKFCADVAVFFPLSLQSLNLYLKTAKLFVLSSLAVHFLKNKKVVVTQRQIRKYRNPAEEKTEAGVVVIDGTHTPVLLPTYLTLFNNLDWHLFDVIMREASLPCSLQAARMTICAIKNGAG